MTRRTVMARQDAHALVWPSVSCLVAAKQDVDARDKPGMTR
jgi:hypothetical protein